MSLLTRRRLLGGAAAFAGMGALEYASFRGLFDHRKGGAPTAVDTFEASTRAAAKARASIVHVGHSTHVIRVDGVAFLTDPWFYDPAFGALAHERGPAIAPEAMRGVDVVLITHDHADHADLRAMDRFPDKRAIEVYVENDDLAARVRALGFGAVHVVTKWTSIKVRGVTLHTVPGVHDIPEVGFVVEGAEDRVYFAGDTAKHDEMPEIAARHEPTYAILPVDGTRLRGGPEIVMNPPTAAEVARLLGVRGAMPSHAESYYTDPIAEHLLTSHVEGARARFVEAMKSVFPSSVCHDPAPGELVLL